MKQHEYNFQYYFGARVNTKGETKPDLKPKGMISITSLYESIKSPKPETLQQIEAIRQTIDPTEKGILKLKLPKVTPCVILKDWKKDENIIQFTGLMSLDFDKLETIEAETLKNDLFNEYSCIMAVWLSSSKKGFRAFVNIPIISLENGIEAAKNEFKEYFNAFRLSLPPKYKGFDESLKSPSKLMFLSFDSDIRIRENSTLFKDRIPEEKRQNERISSNGLPIEIKTKIDEELNNKFNLSRISSIIKKMMDESKVCQNGHHSVLKAAYQLGGFIGAGYIDLYDAETFICALIDRSQYLSKGVDGYKTSAKESLRAGINEPVFLNDFEENKTAVNYKVIKIETALNKPICELKQINNTIAQQSIETPPKQSNMLQNGQIKYDTIKLPLKPALGKVKTLENLFLNTYRKFKDDNQRIYKIVMILDSFKRQYPVQNQLNELEKLIIG